MTTFAELSQTDEYVERFVQHYDHNETPVDADFVYAISDLHTDVKENMNWVDSLQDRTEERAALIVAGDIATSLEVIEATLSKLVKRYIAVWYTVGNHELWMDGGCASETSVDKFFKILDLCHRLGVRTGPGKVSRGVTIVPLFSWWKLNFSGAQMRAALNRMDWQCKWPPNLGGASSHPDVASFFLRLNLRRCSQDYNDDVVISLSHFLPHLKLFYGKPYIGRVMGCQELGELVRRLGSRVHVFGHSHLNTDVMLAKVRFVQHSLGMPRERNLWSFGIFGAGNGPKLIWRSPSKCSLYGTAVDFVRRVYATLRAHIVALALATFS